MKLFVFARLTALTQNKTAVAVAAAALAVPVSQVSHPMRPTTYPTWFKYLKKSSDSTCQRVEFIDFVLGIGPGRYTGGRVKWLNFSRFDPNVG